MNARRELLQLLRAGLESGFILDWRVAGASHGWPGPALLAWALRLRQRWRQRLAPRSRIAVMLPNSPAFLAYWLAAWQGNWVFCPLPPLPEMELERRLRLLAPQLTVLWQDGALREEWHPAAQPVADPEDLASIFWTSASVGPGSAYGLGYDALLWQLQQHAPALDLDRSSLVRNTLSWAHIFAGVLELLPAVAAGTELRVAALSEIRHESFTHLFTVPRIAQLLPNPSISALQGGIIGGAAVDASLAQRLLGSAVRVGYGQSEAGPGILLGEPGVFSVAYVGSRLPQTELELRESLRYRSPGRAMGRWNGQGWEDLQDAQGWVDSGDRVVALPDGHGFQWRGRIDAAFKLADGRGVQPENEELRLQAQYPDLEALILGAPGSRRLTVLASAPPALWRRLRWRERYPLFLLPPEQWSIWQGATGKIRRGDLYAHWRHILVQARRV